MELLTRTAVAAALVALLMGVTAGQTPELGTCVDQSLQVEADAFARDALGCAKEALGEECCGKIHSLFGANGDAPLCLCNQEYFSAVLMGLPGAINISSDDYVNMLKQCKVPVFGQLTCPGTTEEREPEPVVTKQLTSKGHQIAHLIGGGRVIVAKSRPAKTIYIIKKNPAPPTDVPEPPTRECRDVVATASEVPNLSILLEAVQAANLVDVVSGNETILTLFAPTDEAFIYALKALNTTKEEFFSDKELLKDILMLHIVPEATVLSTDLTNQTVTTALEGQDLVVTVVPETGEIFLKTEADSEAKVVTKDVIACSAVVHVIDAVLLPDIDSLVGTATGGEEDINEEDKRVDEEADDQVDEEVAPMDTTATSGDECTTPLNAVLEDEDLSTLASLVVSTGLTGFLDREDLIATVYAPVNSAFETLAAQLGISLDLLTSADAVDAVTEVLNIHITPGFTASADLLIDGQSLTTLVGGVEVLTVILNDGLSIDSPGGEPVKVVSPDIMACETIIRKVDGVLLPSFALDSIAQFG